MLLLQTEKLPDGLGCLCEIKLDAFRAIAFKSGGKVRLRSRNDNEFNGKYPGIAKALSPPSAELAKASNWAKVAREGHEVAWEFESSGGAYTGRMLTANLHALGGHEEVPPTGGGAEC